jgi:hypothetical protein
MYASSRDSVMADARTREALRPRRNAAQGVT